MHSLFERYDCEDKEICGDSCNHNIGAISFGNYYTQKWICYQRNNKVKLFRANFIQRIKIASYFDKHPKEY